MTVGPEVPVGPDLGRFAPGVRPNRHGPYSFRMGMMSISLPDALRSFVMEQVASRGYGTSSEYVRELIRKDRERQRLRSLLLEGAGSAPTDPIDGAYFDRLRERADPRNPA